jgi:DNA-binding transcriptional LysR family regulator
MFNHSFLQMQVYVVAIAEQGSFSRAAKLLGTSPSFLTRKIGNLERTLGVKLFDRSTRKLVLTAAGNVLLPEMQTSLRHGERAWNLAHFWMRIWKGPLRIGYSPLISSNTLLLLHRLDLSELEAGRVGSSLEVPEPRAVLESATNHKLVDLVLRGELHAGVGIMPIEERGLWVEPLMKEPFCLCVPKNHPLAQRPSLAIRELHEQVLYWMPRRVGPLFYDLVKEYIQSTGAVLVYQEICSVTHAIEVVSHGLGIALLPRTASRLSHSGVVFKNVTDRYLQFETAIFARKDIVRGSLKDVFQLVVARLQDQRTRIA